MSICELLRVKSYHKAVYGENDFLLFMRSDTLHEVHLPSEGKVKRLRCVVVCFLVLISSKAYPNSKKRTLLNVDYIKKYLTHQAAWADSHGAGGEDLGAGMLYYSLVYMKKAKLCVCLGSGGGFVPRMMKQAQRDCKLRGARTILVDGNMGDFGRPMWLSNTHFFKQEFPDVEILIMRTCEAAKAHPEWKIDYLHIDADHSFEGAYADFLDFFPLMKKNGVITFHDTSGKLPCAQVIPLLQQQGFEVVNFTELGEGVAMIHLH